MVRGHPCVQKNTCIFSLCISRIYLFIYWGFYVAFNTVQVISQWVVLWAEETSTYSWSRFCTVNLLTIGTQPPTFPHRVRGLNRGPQRREASVLPLRHCGPYIHNIGHKWCVVDNNRLILHAIKKAQKFDAKSSYFYFT